VIAISEVLGVKDDRIETQDIFIFDRTGVSDAGKVQGRYRGTGVVPRILDRLRISGITLPPNLFQETMDVNL
jgi:pilus assembly protein CpaF